LKSYLLFQNVAGPSGVDRQSRPRKRAEKPEAKVRERRGNSNVPSYKDLYSTSSSSEDDSGIPTLMNIDFNILLFIQC
jgi:hypothetical protein